MLHIFSAIAAGGYIGLIDRNRRVGAGAWFCRDAWQPFWSGSIEETIDWLPTTVRSIRALYSGHAPRFWAGSWGQSPVEQSLASYVTPSRVIVHDQQ